ncbi:hypothetical protein MPH_08998 [Macrophomina phaseolina MS6]|uniref:Uncharacterized protein n=1 Tax=Macrophomina phaseolina (strain MS6) TaxID=1126212 RepID=K2RLX1_MACPH|nr:hypothetical protein MPH_08998 [Macrophomina phaseolina MS6]
MRRCLRTFLSRCAPTQLTELLALPQNKLRPLAPKQIEPSSSARAEDGPNAVSGPVKRFPLPANPPPQPPAPREPSPQPPAPANPPPQPPALKKPPSQPPALKESSLQPPASSGKRKRASTASIEISSGSESDSSASLSDTESERATQRRRTGPLSLQQQGGKGSKDASAMKPRIKDICFSNVNIQNIRAVLNLFLPVESCEKLLLPPLHDLGIGLASDHRLSETESRLAKHIEAIKSFKSESDAAKTTIAIYDRINILLLRFEVDMLQPNDDVAFSQGCTHKAYAITQVAQLWEASEIWVKWQLRKANKLIMLMEDHPSYIAELKRRSTTSIPEDKIQAVVDYFRETQARKSATRQTRDFLVCKRIVECLRRVDWTFSEIVQSGSSIIKLLRKHIDLDALGEGHIRPVAPFQEASRQGDGRSEDCEGEAVPSIGIPYSPPATRQQGENTDLSPAHPEARSEINPTGEELKHYGWGPSPNLDLFQFGECDGGTMQFGPGTISLPAGSEDFSFSGPSPDLFQFEEWDNEILRLGPDGIPLPGPGQNITFSGEGLSLSMDSPE